MKRKLWKRLRAAGGVHKKARSLGWRMGSAWNRWPPGRTWTKRLRLPGAARVPGV